MSGDDNYREGRGNGEANDDELAMERGGGEEVTSEKWGKGSD